MKKAVDPITELKRELAALTKKVATLEKQLAKADKRGDLTCTSLTVVDSQGKKVASIDGSGNLFCRSAFVAPKPNQLGVLLDGDNGSVLCLKFALRRSGSNTELVAINGFGGSPSIELCGQNDKVGVRLQAFKNQGGVISVTTKNGGSGVFLGASEGTSFVRVQKPGVRHGGATLSASYVNGGDGVVYTQDRDGNLTGWMPTLANGEQPKVLTEKEMLMASARETEK